MFLESSLDNSLTFSVFICDFDGYVETDYDPYFLFGISMESSTSTRTFINNLWFDIIADLLPSVPTNVSYTECFSMLSNINASNSFLTVPCDEYIASPTSSPTLKPTAMPTIILPPTSSPSQPPTSRPTGVPTAPTAPTAPTFPTPNPTQSPTLRPTTVPTKYPTLGPSKTPTLPTLPTSTIQSTESMESTMIQTAGMAQQSTGIDHEETTITVIVISFLSTLILIFFLSYLWKHKIKAEPDNVEVPLHTSQQQGVREELVDPERVELQSQHLRSSLTLSMLLEHLEQKRYTQSIHAQMTT
eukprot:551673_1